MTEPGTDPHEQSRHAWMTDVLQLDEDAAAIVLFGDLLWLFVVARRIWWRHGRGMVLGWHCFLSGKEEVSVLVPSGYFLRIFWFHIYHYSCYIRWLCRGKWRRRNKRGKRQKRWWLWQNSYRNCNNDCGSSGVVADGNYGGRTDCEMIMMMNTQKRETYCIFSALINYEK